MATKAKTYFEKLKDPRWQRLRLEVMQAADFKCEECCDAEKTLNVHHRFYRKGAEPWEYEAGELQCLCEGCHKERHVVMEKVKEVIGSLDTRLLHFALGYAQGLLMGETADPWTEEDVTEFFSPEAAYGIADAYGIQGNKWQDLVLQAGVDRSICHKVLVQIHRLSLGKAV